LPEPKLDNLKRWIESHEADKWVEAHSGQWSYAAPRSHGARSVRGAREGLAQNGGWGWARRW
jgi:hypothetical protein